jgi:hypothetical protein
MCVLINALMFVLTTADGLCCVGLYTLSGVNVDDLRWGLALSIWPKMNVFYLKAGTESSQ